MLLFANFFKDCMQSFFVAFCLVNVDSLQGQVVFSCWNHIRDDSGQRQPFEVLIKHLQCFNKEPEWLVVGSVFLIHVCKYIDKIIREDISFKTFWHVSDCFIEIASSKPVKGLNERFEFLLLSECFECCAILLVPDLIYLKQDHWEWHMVKLQLREGCKIETGCELLKLRPSS